MSFNNFKKLVKNTRSNVSRWDSQNPMPKCPPINRYQLSTLFGWRRVSFTLSLLPERLSWDYSWNVFGTDPSLNNYRYPESVCDFHSVADFVLKSHCPPEKVFNDAVQLAVENNCKYSVMQVVTLWKADSKNFWQKLTKVKYFDYRQLCDDKIAALEKTLEDAGICHLPVEPTKKEV